MSEPLLTVALPTCNGARHLPEAIRGLRAQEAEGVAFDLLVCDDRSEDDTREVVRRELGDRARIVLNPYRLGLAGNWNRCAALSRTPYVAIVHQDDVLLPGHLARALAAFEGLTSHGPPGFVVGAATAIDAEGRPLPPGAVDPGTPAFDEAVGRLPPDAIGGRVLFYGPGGFVPALAAENPLRCSGVVLSRDAHEAVGGFDASYRYAVDWDFWLRVAGRYAVAWILEPPGVAFRWHAASETHRFKTGLADLAEQERLLAGVLGGDAPSRALRRVARRRLARAYLNRAYDAAHAGDRLLQGRALARAIRLDPATAARLAADPRLLARLVLGPRSGQPGRDST
jgi:glycosyltransferase involved in cell wall biosynthesis